MDSTEKYAQHLFEQNTIRRSPKKKNTGTPSPGSAGKPTPRLALPLDSLEPLPSAQPQTPPDHPPRPTAQDNPRPGLQPLPRLDEPAASLSQLRAHKIAHLNHLLKLPTNASLAAAPAQTPSPKQAQEQQPQRKAIETARPTPSKQPPAVTAAAPAEPSPEQKALQTALRSSQARLKRTQLQLDMAQILLQNQISLETCLNEVLDRLLKNFGLWAGALRTISIGHPVRPQRLNLQKMQRRLPDWPQPGTFQEKPPVKPVHSLQRAYQQWTYGIYHKDTCWGQLAIAYSPAQQLAAEDEIALHALLDDLGFFLSVWHQQQQQLSAQEQDPLTGLLNHSALQHALEKHLHQKMDLPLSLVVLNLDLLRQINEVHGFEHGDRALQAVAKLLSTPEFLPLTVSRFGPESFVFLCPQTPAEQAAKKAENLRRAIAQLSLPGKYNSTIGITASFGVVSVSQPNEKAHQMVLEQALVALEQAKSLGRNQVKIYAEPVAKKASVTPVNTPAKAAESVEAVEPAEAKLAPQVQSRTAARSEKTTSTLAKVQAPKTAAPVKAEARKWSDILAEQQANIASCWQEKTDDYGVKEVSEAVEQLNKRLERLLNSLFGLLDQSSTLEDLAKMPVSYFMPSPVVAAIRRGSANAQLISYEVAFMLLQESLIEVLKSTQKAGDSLEPAIDAFFHCINEKMTQLKNEVKK